MAARARVTYVARCSWRARTLFERVRIRIAGKKKKNNEEKVMSRCRLFRSRRGQQPLLRHSEGCFSLNYVRLLREELEGGRKPMSLSLSQSLLEVGERTTGESEDACLQHGAPPCRAALSPPCRTGDLGEGESGH